MHHVKTTTLIVTVFVLHLMCCRATAQAWVNIGPQGGQVATLQVFERTSDGTVHTGVRIVLNRKGSNRIGPQVVVDAPVAESTVRAAKRIPTGDRRSRHRAVAFGLLGTWIPLPEPLERL